MISPTIFFNLVMGIIGSFQVFTDAYVATQGGPMDATLVTVLYLYLQAFGNLRMGYASAIAWVLFVIIMFFTLLIIRSSTVWVFYETEIGGKKA
jgi:multiple sugar transport system permease protein